MTGHPRHTFHGIVDILASPSRAIRHSRGLTSYVPTDLKCQVPTLPLQSVVRHDILVTGRYASRSSHGRKKAQTSGVNNPSDASIANTKLRDITSVTDGNDCSTSNLAQVLKANGFKTGMVGKWHLSKTNTEGDSIDGVRAAINECGFEDVEVRLPMFMFMYFL